MYKEATTARFVQVPCAYQAISSRKKKTLWTYKPIVWKINCAVTPSQKREKILIYAKALIFFGELAYRNW